MALPLNTDPSQIQRAQAQAIRAQEELHQKREKREASISAIVSKIHQARKNAEDAANDLQEAAVELRTLARKDYDDSSGTYVVYASAHLRLAGALLQGARRTGSMDRLLANAKRDQEEAKSREDESKLRQEVRVHASLVRKLELPTDDAFEELYGEVVTDALI